MKVDEEADRSALAHLTIRAVRRSAGNPQTASVDLFPHIVEELPTGAQQYPLSPACDILPSGQALGFQQMRVGESEADSTLANALSMARMFSLDTDAAVKQVAIVVRVISRWKQHFRRIGVRRADIDLYAEQIDRPFLSDQRKEFGRSA